MKRLPGEDRDWLRARRITRVGIVLMVIGLLIGVWPDFDLGTPVALVGLAVWWVGVRWMHMREFEIWDRWVSGGNE